MKLLVHVGMMLALTGVAASCDSGKSVEGNLVQTHKPSKPAPPKCSVRHPLACKSSGILMVGPDFQAELRRFVGKAQFDPNSVWDPSDHLFGPGDPSFKPEPIEKGLTFVADCPLKKCTDGMAVILQNGRILAFATQYSERPYDWDGGDAPFSSLDIFIERPSPQSARSIEIMRSWGDPSKNVRVHDLSLM